MPSSQLSSWVWGLFVGWGKITSSEEQIKDTKQGDFGTWMMLDGLGELSNSPSGEELTRGKERWPFLWDRKGGRRIALTLVSLKMVSVKPRAFPMGAENYSTSELGLWSQTDPINSCVMFGRSHFWHLQNGTNNNIYHILLWVLSYRMQSSW